MPPGHARISGRHLQAVHVLIPAVRLEAPALLPADCSCCMCAYTVLLIYASGSMGVLIKWAGGTRILPRALCSRCGLAASACDAFAGCADVGRVSRRRPTCILIHSTTPMRPKSRMVGRMEEIRYCW